MALKSCICEKEPAITKESSIPLPKWKEECYGVIMGSNRRHRDFSMRVGDVLVAHDDEGIVLKTVGIGGIIIFMGLVDK